jgi:hypothetical protein
MSGADEILKGSKYVIVDTEIFKKLIWNQRKDIQKKICSSNEAMNILSCSKRKFSELYNDPKTKLRKSKFQGKWVLDSVYEEAERISEKK